MDPLQVVIDVTDLRITGYRAADFLYDHASIDMHLSDHRRISAQLSFADTPELTGRLIGALRDLAAQAGSLQPGSPVAVPDPGRLRLPQAMTPREAYFADWEAVPVAQAAGRVCTEILTPYPPGIPACCPGNASMPTSWITCAPASRPG